jgi:hypothetical protein
VADQGNATIRRCVNARRSRQLRALQCGMRLRSCSGHSSSGAEHLAAHGQGICATNEDLVPILVLCVISHATEVGISWFGVIRYWWRRPVDAVRMPSVFGERLVDGNSDLGLRTDGVLVTFPGSL